MDGHARGAAGGGRGGRGSSGAAHGRPGPHTIDELHVMDIEEMPRSPVIEQRLHPKRKRSWRPYHLVSTTPPPPTASTSTAELPSVVVVEGESSSSVAEAAPVSPAYSVPSPAMYVKCGPSARSSPMQRQRPRPRRILRDYEISDIVNYGSEPSSDESDEERWMSPYLPPICVIEMETPFDADDDSAFDQQGGTSSVQEVAPLQQEEVPLPQEAPIVDTELPHSFSAFDWKSFPNTSISPGLRRERFSKTNVGPTTPCADPYEIFVSIWDRQFMEYIASETNRYAQQVAQQMFDNHCLHPHSRIAKWVDITVDELYTHLAITMAMGVVILARLEEYWSATSDIFSTPGFRAYMSINRFLLINKCLHFSNNEDMCALNLESSEAKLFKIKPVLLHLNMKFSTMYNLSQNIALDESLLQWKGWLNIIQLVPNKAATMGIKSYEICESQTGYLWRFEIHAHKSSPSQQHEDPLTASAPSIVLRLVQGLEHKGHTLWMDNFYNSPILARRLKCIGFDCAGTLRTNRKFVPQALHSLTKQNMRPGEITGLTSGDVDVMVWRDTNRVAMISTYHGNGVGQLGGSTKPILILDYNIMMGGVDKKDQMLAAYPVERKRTRVWYKKLFKRLLNVSVLNSYIIHRHSPQPLSHRNFRKHLITSLFHHHSRPPPPPPPPQNPLQPTQVQQSIDVLTHHLDFLPSRRGQHMRRKCSVCRKLVATICVGCDKTVCMKPCFVTMHCE